ncbi:hypothetical protein DRH29_02900 [candidate division Kazan bacterium]|uniref:Uncharacterized protein n=1 Tax=candidate division Kazan bacterium TaxID=2202143 RepID=A0A420ZCN4_UNCK3|nr:MAG: hypothetical protein DRH29_02900 [candidate division Kazan bacterium]
MRRQEVASWYWFAPCRLLTNISLLNEHKEYIQLTPRIEFSRSIRFSRVYGDVYTNVVVYDCSYASGELAVCDIVFPFGDDE